MSHINEWVNLFGSSQFKKLKPRVELDSYDVTISRNVLTYRSGDILLWNENSLSVHSFNLQCFVADSKTSYSQELIWNNPPKFDVHQILLSPSESQLALCGSERIQILSLPLVRGKHGLFKDGAKTISCQCANVDEKYFVISENKVLCCKWHPGFSSPDVLFVLVSDNFFRIYKADCPAKPIKTIDLNTLPNVSLSSKNVLGEYFISFDFGGVSERDSNCEESLNSSQVVPDSAAVACTAYLLIGNGQVCTCSVVFDGSSFKYKLEGPLKMYPAAEDNYGCDACSILHVDTNPGVVVVATCEGKLHHCILLHSETNCSEFPRDRLNNSGRNLRERPDFEEEQMSLYVYETVELELSLKTAHLESSFNRSSHDIDPFNCPIQLYRDPVAKERYHCCHISGLHTVLLTWLYKLDEFFQNDDAVDDKFNQDEQCIVEHLLCTKPLVSSPLTPIIGFTQVADTILGSKVICLTADYEATIFPLLQSYKSLSCPLSIEHSLDLQTKSPSRFREDLSEKIAKMLLKKAKNPIIKGSLSNASTPQECFQLLCRATQVFREEYIQKYDQAGVEINRKLQKMETRQMEELKLLSGECEKISQQQVGVREKLQKIISRQHELSGRLSEASCKIEKSIQVLSGQEEKMLKTLKDFQETVDNGDKSISHLRKKSEHILKVIEKSNVTSNKSSDHVMDRDKTDSIHILLKNEGDEIALLQSEIKRYQAMVEI